MSERNGKIAVDHFLDQCVSLFGLRKGRLLSDWHAFTVEAGECVVRVTHSTHRTLEEVEAEVEWLEFLVGRGFPCSSVVPAKSGKLVESLPCNDGYYSVVCCNKLGGVPIDEALWGKDLFVKWGKLIGRLHRLSTDFRPNKRRYDWYQSDFLNVEAYIPSGLAGIKENAQAIINQVKALPSNDYQYGLIHADVYQDNFFWQEDGLSLFDFDNCEYGHFVSDVAIALYAALWRLPDRADPFAFAQDFLPVLFDGYRSEHELSGTELAALPLFLKLREVLIYIVARKKLDLSNLSPISAKLLAERGERIERNLPIVDIGPILDGI